LALTNAKAGDLEVVTTYRDPLRTAASWGNRGELKRDWIEYWNNWVDLMETAPSVFHVSEFKGPVVNSYPDKLGLHKAIDDEDWDYFYSVAPRNMVSHAMEASKCYM